MLTDIERKVMSRIEELNKPRGLAMLKNPEEPTLLSLQSRGYIRIDNVVCGPIPFRTGEKCAVITEAGAIAMQH